MCVYYPTLVHLLTYALCPTPHLLPRLAYSLGRCTPSPCMRYTQVYMCVCVCVRMRERWEVNAEQNINAQLYMHSGLKRNYTTSLKQNIDKILLFMTRPIIAKDL